ncbi:MAG: N-acetyl-gamma-glutamyl-phosphate reductase [Thermoproteota archaeon]
MDKTRVGVIGGSGYVGGELLRILLLHPGVEVTLATSQRYASNFVFDVHPNLRGSTTLRFIPYELSRCVEDCDLVFTAVPHGSSVKITPNLLEAGLKVIDTSADFRLKDAEEYPKLYGWKHPLPELLEESVSGLPELHREEIKDARLIACPGCMALPTILGLTPLVKAGVIEKERIIADIKIGSSGAGNTPTIASHHPERFGGVRPYKPVGHRHTAEIEQELNSIAGESMKVSFSPHAVNMVRGILSTVHVFTTESLTNKTLWKLYRSQYQDEPFVRIVRYRKGLYRLPDPKVLVGSNFCDVGFELDSHANRLVIFSAIDNLIKGAAGAAVHCLNLVLGVNERTALEGTGLHPV